MSTTPTVRELVIGEIFTRLAAVSVLGAACKLIEPLAPDAEQAIGGMLSAGSIVVVPYVGDDVAVEGGRENAERYAFAVDLEILVPLALLKGSLKPYQVAARIHAAFYNAIAAPSPSDSGTLGGRALLVDTPEGYAGPFGIDPSSRGYAVTSFTCRVQYRHAYGDPGVPA